MPDINGLLNKLPIRNDKKLWQARQDTWDIIRDVLKNHSECTQDYDSICEDFHKGDALSTAKEIFNFCRTHLPYDAESPTVQTVKTPAVILWKRKHLKNDCKHYASFIVGIFSALKRKGYPYKVFYRFASYNPGDRNPGHVFAVVVINGRELWVDPVLKFLDQRRPQYYFKLDKEPPMAVYKLSGVLEEGVLGNTYDIPMNGVHWTDELFQGNGSMGKLHLRATDFLFPGSHEARLIHDKLKKKGIKPHATDFLIPGSGLFRRLHALRKKKHHAAQSGVGMGAVDYELSGMEDEIAGFFDDNLAGIPWYNFAVGKVKKQKKPKDPNKKKGGIFKKILKGAGKITMKVSGAASRNSYLLLLKMNAFHVASNIMKKVKDPGQSAGERKILPTSAAWKKLAGFWKKLGGNEKVLWGDIVQGTRVWNKHHKAHAIHGISNQSYIGFIDYVSGLPEEDNAIGNPVAIAAILAAAAPIIAGLKSVLKSFGIDTSNMHKGATDAEADVADNHNDSGEDGADSDGAVDHGGGIKTKVTHNDDGSQTVQVDATTDSGGYAPSGGTPNHASVAPAADAPDDGGGDDTSTDVAPPAGGSPGGGITNFMATAGEFVKAHKPYVIGGVVIVGVVGLYKLVIHPASRDYGYVRGKRK